MKNVLLLFIFLFCSKVSFSQLPVSTETELRKYILEEFTGMYCSFCPSGHLNAKELVDSNPGQVIPINIHTGNFAEPNSTSDPDFTTSFGDAIGSLCNVGTFPSGIVNRELFPGLGSSSDPTVLSYSSWEYVVPQILEDTSYVNIALDATINVLSRELEVDVELYFSGDAPDAVNLNIALLQNNVLGPQANGFLINPDQVSYDGSYKHMHMLRHQLTGQWGQSIDSTDIGTTISRHFSYTIPFDYNDVDVELGQIEIVGFVNEGQKDIITGGYAEINYTGLYDDNAGLKDIVKLDKHCGDELDGVVVYFENQGRNDITSLKFEYQVTGKPVEERIWNGQISFSDQDSIHISGIDVSGITTGLLEVEIVEVNGNTDPDLVGNSLSEPITHIINTTNENELEFYFIQDQIGSETTWEIIDNSTGNIINTGGPYGVIPNGAPLDTHVISVSLDHLGCHTINVYDSGHNGINNYFGAGGYKLKTLSGNVVLESDGIFRGVETQYFYAGELNIGLEEYQNEIKLYPNPATETVMVSSDIDNIREISIHNLNGQRVYYSDLDLSNTHSISLTHFSSGIYFVSIRGEKQSAIRKLIVR